jgi:WhiB family redox-sensing transcriptional regulator
MATNIVITTGTTTPHHWRQYARCLGADPELFHPPADDPADEAKAICAICPVREPCLEYAITAREKQGVWGGLTEKERRRLIRQRRRSA